MIVISYTCLLFISFPTFAQRLIYSPDIPIKRNRVILEQTHGGRASEMLTDLKYTPLEGNRNNLINYISKAKIIGNRLAIITSNDGHLFLYSLDGKLIKKISKIDGFKPRWGNALFYQNKEKDGDFLLSHGNFFATIDSEGHIKDTVTKIYEQKNDFVEQWIKVGSKEYGYINPRYNEKKI